MEEVRLKASEAAYLWAFATFALQMRFIRETIDDEADQVIGDALGRIGQQLAEMRYEDGLPVEELLPLIFQPRAYLDLGLGIEASLRESLQGAH